MTLFCAIGVQVGDQDWLTVLGWHRPELFHLLPCIYNVQVHQVQVMLFSFELVVDY